MTFWVKKKTSFIKKFDIFGQPILLSFKGKTKYKTYVGGIFTLIQVGIIIGFSFEATVSLIQRDNTRVSFSQIYEEKPPLIEFFPNKGFTFAIGFSQDYLNDPTSKYFDIQIINYSVTRFENGTRIKTPNEIKLKICEHSDFPADYDFLQNGLKNYLCLDKNQSFRLSGTYFSQKFEYSQIIIKRCKNSTLKNNCASPEVTEELSKTSIYFNFLFTNKILNLHNHSNPIFSYLNSEVFFLIDPKKYKQADLFFQRNMISSDDNIWFYQSKFRTEDSYVNLKEHTSESMRDEIGVFYLRSNFMVGNYIVTSEKITALLSKIGGLISIIYNLLQIFINPYVKKKLLISLSKYLYKFIPDEKIDDKNTFDSKGDKNFNKARTKEFKLEREDNENSMEFPVCAEKKVESSVKFLNFKNLNENSAMVHMKGKNDGNPFEVSGLEDNLGKNLKEIEFSGIPSGSTGPIFNRKSVTNSNDAGIPKKSPDETIFSETNTPKEFAFALDFKNGEPPNILEEKYSEIINEIQNQANKIKYTFLDFVNKKIYRLLKRKLTTRQHLLNEAKTKVKKELFIINILRRMQELEKLKILMLSKDQQNLLALLEKPVIMIENTSELSEKIKGRRRSSGFSQRMQKISYLWESDKSDYLAEKRSILEKGFKHYIKIKSSDHRSELDERLLNFMDERMKFVDVNRILKKI